MGKSDKVDSCRLELEVRTYYNLQYRNIWTMFKNIENNLKKQQV